MTQKYSNICVKILLSMSKHLQSTDTKIMSCIQENGVGWVFTPAHFHDLGSRNAVASALKRFKAAGTIRQLARGIYDYPIQDPVLGTITPSADSIAKSLAARNAIRLQPSGAYAANIIGLSEQVPVKIILLTDGSTRHVRIGQREIILKHTTPRNMATAGRKSGIFIQALRYLGKNQVDEKIKSIISRQIKPEDCKQIYNDLQYAPVWIANILRPLVQQTA